MYPTKMPIQYSLILVTSPSIFIAYHIRLPPFELLMIHINETNIVGQYAYGKEHGRLSLLVD